MSQILVADGGGNNQTRPMIQVAVGVLIDWRQRVLMTTRPAGKVYAGYWEFPGGKLEAQETVVQALQRELKEEIGVCIDPSTTQHWREQIVDYPHALVHLHFCKVTHWSGTLSMNEGQTFEWVWLPAHTTPILPGAVPVLNWLAQERQAGVTTTKA